MLKDEWRKLAVKDTSLLEDVTNASLDSQTCVQPSLWAEAGVCPVCVGCPDIAPC